MARQLSEMQQKFLAALSGEANWDHHKAKELAGYSEGTNVYVIMAGLKEEIGKEIQTSMTTTGAIKAYKSLLKVLDGTDDPLGRKERVSVAKDLLDRSGHKATDKLEVTTPNNVFILPPKENATS